MKVSSIAAALTLQVAIVAPVQAQAPAEDLAATAVNEHEVGKLNVYGDAKGEIVDNPALPGGKAVRVTVNNKGANPWDSGITSRITAPVRAGDEIAFVFYAKLISGENGATSVTLPANNISSSSPPYQPLVSAPATVGTTWKRLRQRWIADKDYAPGSLQAGLQLGTGKQVIDIGPIFVSKVASGVALPPARKIVVVEDLSSKIVNDPTPEVNGARGSLLTGAAPSGGNALRVAVKGKGANVWDSNVETSIKKPIRKGDKIVLMFDARLEAGPGGAATATIPNAAVQQKAAPYKSFFNGQPALTTSWKSFRYEGVADQDYPADAVKSTIQVGNARQTIDFANIVVLNMGQ